MKKLMYPVLLIALAVLFGCQGKDNNAGSHERAVTLKMGFQAGTASNEYAAAELFAKRANELSDGSVTVQIFSGGQLGDDRSMMEQTAQGALDVVFAETGRFGLWIPEMEIFGYPFAFNSFDHLLKTMETPYGTELQAKLIEKGWRILADGYNGTRQTTCNRPINSIEDMQGLKLRVPNAAANLNFAKYSGASPTPMAFAEVYLALKTNAVDGQENPLSTINAQKFYEVQKYCALTAHILNDNNYVISEITWKKLSDKQKNAVQTAAKEAADLQTQKFTADETSLLESFKQNGMTITNPDRIPFRVAMKPMYDAYIEKYGDVAIKAIEAVNHR